MNRPHALRVYRSNEPLARTDQLAWAIAEVAADPVEPTDAVVDMVVNRVIDNAAVAAASLTRAPVASARAQALCHPPSTGGSGALVFGLPEARVSPEWAAWANGTAVRELDFHDTFLAAEYAHPGDNIPPILAVAQHRALRDGLTGHDVVRAIVAGYEIQVALARSISLHQHKVDHVAHLGPSAAAGIGALLGLDVSVIHQAIGQALHTTTATRQSRKGQISTWKAFAPAFAGKAAIEAVDRAMRGQTSPEPIYEGEDGVVATMLDGPDARYEVPLPELGAPRRAILDTFTKEHSAEYQAQAWIDLARRLRDAHPRLIEPGVVEQIVIRTSHHTHVVIGSGAGDPQKYDPTASRETLDHSLPYIVAVALQDGRWHHVDSYAPERAARPDTVALWRSIRTQEDPEWTKRYHAPNPMDRAYGGAIEITCTDGTVITDEIARADAHPRGARPFAREQYVEKFRTLADGVLTAEEIERFLDRAQALPDLGPDELASVTVNARPGLIDQTAVPEGLF